jgi:8-oxo-dGTP pyrophosphatase MutT (NUDIX family)
VVREVKEETGFDVTPGRVTGIYTDPRSVIAFADGEVRQQFSICFLCTIAGGGLAVSSESTEVRFVAPAEIDLLAIGPTIRLRIRHYLENRADPAVT